MSLIEILKFGSSVLRSASDLPIAVDEIYRHFRSGKRVLAVVSAFEGVTDRLLRESTRVVGDFPEAVAAYVATGECQTAALLLGSLQQHGLPAKLIEPRDIALTAQGSCLESVPVSVDRAALERFWHTHPVLVLPGYYGLDGDGRILLFGRGGSDFSALFLAAKTGGRCRLLKDVPGVFTADPRRSADAQRFSALTWAKATEVSGPLIQPNALSFARAHDTAFEVGRPNGFAGTLVGHGTDEWEAPVAPVRPLRIALAGCGSVGRGVYEAVQRYPERFEIVHVIVRDPGKHADVKHVTPELSRALDAQVDVVIVCFGGTTAAHALMQAALTSGKYVITANKAAAAAHDFSLLAWAQLQPPTLYYSAAVGGAMPAVEAFETLSAPVQAVRGVINGTCGVVLEAMAAGRTWDDALAHAQAAGFAEADPSRDVSGRDAADKLALLIRAAFGVSMKPESIATTGIDSITGPAVGYQLIARAVSHEGGVDACVVAEKPPAGGFLAATRGAENRLEIELVDGQIIRLRAQGAGRWPTTVSVMGDLHELARRHRAAGSMSRDAG
jgi:homoserine dehydrogenase